MIKFFHVASKEYIIRTCLREPAAPDSQKDLRCSYQSLLSQTYKLSGLMRLLRCIDNILTVLLMLAWIPRFSEELQGGEWFPSRPVPASSTEVDSN